MSNELIEFPLMSERKERDECLKRVNGALRGGNLIKTIPMMLV